MLRFEFIDMYIIVYITLISFPKLFLSLSSKGDSDDGRCKDMLDKVLIFYIFK